MTVEIDVFQIIQVHKAGHDVVVAALAVLERVGDVHDAGETEFVIQTAVRVMVTGDGFDERNGQAPDGEQVSADFGVGGIEMFAFDDVDGRLGGVRFREDGRVFLRQTVGQNNFADVVQHAGGEGLFGQVRVIEIVVEQAAAKDADLRGVIPDLFDGELRTLAFVERREQRRGQGERLDDTHAEQLHGFVHGKDFAAETEERGVGELQQLGGERGITRGDFGDAFRGGRGRLDGVGDLEIQFREAGEIFQAGGEFADLAVAQLRLHIGDATQATFQIIETTGLVEKLVREADAFHDLAQFRITGKHDAHGLWMFAEHVIEELRAIDAGHAHVGDDDIERLQSDLGEGLFAALDELHIPFRRHGTHA